MSKQLDRDGVRKRLRDASIEDRYRITEKDGRILVQVMGDTSESLTAYQDLARTMFGDAGNVVVSDGFHTVEYS